MGKRKATGTSRRSSRRHSGGGGSKPPPPPTSPPPPSQEEEEWTEGDCCFVCKDGGLLLLCDIWNCGKAYHPECVGKDGDSVKSVEEFICDWHTCFICKGRSYHRCLCCPSNSVCRGCLRQSDFAQLSKSTNGFCTDCLRMVIMIEKNVEVDSDGEWADFSDKETYEYLFKEYWKIINRKERLTLDNLQEAYAHIKMSPNCNQMSDSKSSRKEQHSSDDDFLGSGDDGEDEPGCQFKQGNSKSNVYVGWGSKELIGFLSSIGKDTSKSRDQFGAAEVVKEYIRQKGLLPKEKKKHVICDDKLWTLFRKSKLKYNKIYSLLERHIAAKNTSEEETLANSEDNSDSISIKKRKTRTMTSEPSSPKRISEKNKRCFASLVRDNINLIYLRRSLIMDLLKMPETFENKVIGCFVRLKKDPEDYRYHRPRLGQVTGIRKSTEEYKVKDVSTDVLLRVSSIKSEVKISMLSDEDVEEDECENLRLLVLKEHSKRHTVAELEEKARSVHRDIVSHWIVRELKRLERLIEIANEKGWRIEMYHLIDKRQLLCTPSEKQRLVEEVPQVIPDTEDNDETKFISGINEERVGCLKSCSGEKSKATEADADGDRPGMGVQKKGTTTGSDDNAAGDKPGMDSQKQGTKAEVINIDDDKNGSLQPGMDVQKQGTKAVITAGVINTDDDKDGSLQPGMDVQKQGTKAEVININDGKNGSLPNEGGDLTAAHPVPHESGDARVAPQHEPNNANMWHYIDALGDEQGPFSIEVLRCWKRAGPYFNNDSRVWRAGESRDSSILLTDALRLAR